MTDLDHLIRRLEADPDSDIGAAMLIDELMDARGMLYTEAERHVRQLQADARSVLQMTFVAELIRAKGPAHDALHELIRELAGLSKGEAYTLFVTSGSEAPSGGVRGATINNRLLGPGLVIFLPAGWVCAWFRRQVLPIRAAKKPRGGE